MEQEPASFSESTDDHGATTLATTVERLRSSTAAGGFVLGAFVDGAMVGMAGFYRSNGIKTQHQGHIWGVYVKKRYRRRGIARTLMAETLRRARLTHGLEQADLSVMEGQGGAKQLYQSLGFQTYGRQPRALQVGGTYLDKEMMILRLW